MKNIKPEFIKLILTCCRLNESELRLYIKKLLLENSFTIQEDNYYSTRLWECSGIHNLIAIRGEPNVCLVSHTDVCRDHDLIWKIFQNPKKSGL